MKKQKAFTLIEMLVYLGLFAILMLGMVTAAYGIFESSDRDQAKIMVQEEGNFLLAKINWALSGVEFIESPPVGQSSSTLSVNRLDVSGMPSTTTISLAGTDVNISNGGNPALTLNNSNVEVRDLLFSHNYSGIYQEDVEATYTLYARTQNGVYVSSTFHTLKYIRK